MILKIYVFLAFAESSGRKDRYPEQAMFYVTTGNTLYYIYFLSDSGNKSVEEEEFFVRYLSNQQPGLRMVL